MRGRFLCEGTGFAHVLRIGVVDGLIKKISALLGADGETDVVGKLFDAPSGATGTGALQTQSHPLNGWL